MNCQNYFCVYWKNKKCILKSVSLDIQGRCEEYIHIDINKNVLESEKEKLLKKLCID